jgi:nucleoid-associated protein YgaU
VAGVAAGPGPRSGLRSLDPAAASLVVATAEASRAPTGGAPEPFRSTEGDDPASRPVMRLLPPEAPGAAEVVPPSAPVLAIERASPPAAAPVTGAEREIRPGDHLWSVAATVLHEAWGAPATDHEVAPYWRRLVEANRAVLADPANPDLLYPGQVVAVPAPGSGSV